jgi:5'-methylthioadenosine phosphorylase
MTNVPEVKLAREAELCYATLALVTDYDVWHETEAEVTVEAVVRNLLKNVETAKEVLRRVIPRLRGPRTCACPDLLRNAVITSPAAFPPSARRRLDLLIGKYFPTTRPEPTARPRRPAAPLRAPRRRGKAAGGAKGARGGGPRRG